MIKLLDFNAKWCGPCRAIAPVLEEIAREHSSKVELVKIDVDEDNDKVIQYQVTSVPTLIFIRDGQIVNRLSGLRSKSDIEDIIRSL